MDGHALARSIAADPPATGHRQSAARKASPETTTNDAQGSATAHDPQAQSAHAFARPSEAARRAIGRLAALSFKRTAIGFELMA